MPILLSVGLVLASPLGLIVIFLSGDSCCGENTSGTMLGVTFGILVMQAVLAVALSSLVKVASKAPGFSLPVASLIVAGPASAIYIVFVLFLVATAF